MDKHKFTHEQNWRPLVLASASPRRLELLARTGIPCSVIPSGVDEVVPGPHVHPRAPEVCLENARRKTKDVAARLGDACLVLAADTIVVVGGVVLGKPKDAEDARRMLRLLSGRTHQVLTGCAIVDTAGGPEQSYLVTTDVTFKPLLEDEITGYVATGEPMDKAGAYGIQGRGAFLVATIQGSYTNVVGLPLAETLDVLARMGGPRAFASAPRRPVTPL